MQFHLGGYYKFVSHLNHPGEWHQILSAIFWYVTPFSFPSTIWIQPAPREEKWHHGAVTMLPPPNFSVVMVLLGSYEEPFVL